MKTKIRRWAAWSVCFLATTVSARAVEVSHFVLTGAIEEENARFTLSLRAEAPRAGGRLTLVEGEIALLDATLPRGVTIEREPHALVARFEPARWRGRRGPVRISFASRVTEVDGERRTAFHLPDAPVRRVEFHSARADLDVRFPHSRTTEAQPDGGGGKSITAFLVAGEPFQARWKPAVPILTGDLAASCDARLVALARVGAMQILSELHYEIAQGRLQRIELDVPPGLSITEVSGADLRSWHVDSADGGGRLIVALSRPQTERYVLQVIGETVLPDFPAAFEIPIPAPRDVIRTSGFLLLGTDSAIRLSVTRSIGLTQMDPASFPRSSTMEPAFTWPERSVYAYQFAGMPVQANVAADDIVTVIHADHRLVCSVSDNELSLTGVLDIDVRDAPARELQLNAPDGWVAAAVTGPHVADVEVKESDTGRSVTVYFREPLLGRTLIHVQLERVLHEDISVFNAPRLNVVGARSERGFIAFRADPGIRLDLREAQGLREVHAGSLPQRVPDAQHALRFREADWSLAVDVHREAPSIHAEVFHLVALGEGGLFGSSSITYAISGAPVRAFRLEIPASYQNVEITGRDVRGFRRGEDGWIVSLQERVLGDYTLLVTYTEPVAYEGGGVLLGGIHTQGTESESGYLALAGAAGLEIEAELERDAGVLPLTPGEIPREYALLVSDTVLRGWKYVGVPHRVRVVVRRHATHPLIGQIADHLALSTRLSAEGEAVTEALFFVKNTSGQHLAFSLPQGAALWSVQVDDVDARALEDETGMLLVPIERRRDPNEPIAVRVVYAEQRDAIGRAGRVAFQAPILGTRGVFARWTFEPPEDYRFVRAGGTLAPPAADVRGLSALTTRLIALGRWGATRGLGWLLVAGILAGVGALWVWNRARGRPWHFTGCIMLAAIPVLLALLIAAIPGRFALPPRAPPAPQAGVWSLTRPVTLPGGELEARLWVVRNRVAGLVLAVRTGVALLVSAGLFRAGARRPRRRPLAWSLALLLLLWAMAGLPHGGSAAAGVAVLLLGLLGFTGLFRRIHAAGRRRRSPIADRPAGPDEALSFMGRVPEAARSGSDGAVSLRLLLWLLASGGAVLAAGHSAAGMAPAPFDTVTIAVHAPPPDAAHPGIAHAEIRLSFEAERGRHAFIPTGSLAISAVQADERRLKVTTELDGYRIETRRGGRHSVVVRGLVPVQVEEGAWMVDLPMPNSLHNRVDLRIDGAGLEVDALDAVYAAVEEADGLSHAVFHFDVSDSVVLRWRPKERATRLEQTILFAEVHSLALCRPGLTAFTHEVRYQVAQGEMRVMRVEMPADESVTAVTGPGLTTWRFDPQTRVLEARLERPVSGAYVLHIAAQTPRDRLPYEAMFEAPVIRDVERQRGAFAIATVEAVQIGIEPGDGITGMSVADFPADVFTAAMDAQLRAAAPEIRRAFRYHRLPARGSVRATRVWPEIRVAEESSLDLSLDRTTLTSRMRVDIAKAGLFSVRLRLPDGFDVDSLSGDEVSHWDEHRDDGEPEVVVHFVRQALGARRLNIVLSRMERETAEIVAVPRVQVADAMRQTGTLTITTERGLRLTATDRDGVSELNPREMGVRPAQAALAFRLLRPDWSVALQLETTAPVVKADVLQRVDLSEGMLHMRAVIHYGIEQAGVKTFRLRAPRPGVGLTISGRHIARVMEVDPEAGVWEVELNGRVEEQYTLEATCSLPFDPADRSVRIRGIEPLDVDRARGYLVIFAGGRLHVQPRPAPDELHPEDPRGIPGRLGGGDLSGAALAYRVTRLPYTLELAVLRHGSAELLPARIESVRLTTVAAEDEQRITRADLRLRPGSLRLLETRLPAGAEVWSVFVNERAVRPLIEGNLCLLPLSADAEGWARVEIIYGDRGGVGSGSRRRIEGPTFNLPLQDVEWAVYVPPGRSYSRFRGTLTPRPEASGDVIVFSAEEYAAWNRALAADSLRKAEHVLERGQAYWREGRPEDARRALQEAVTYSRGQVDLNEDARIQYRNLVRQQAVVGLATRRAALRAERNIMVDADEAHLRAFRDGDWDAEHGRMIEEQLGARESESLGRVAERLFDQQEAAEADVHPVRITVPLQGRRQVFTRALHVQEHGPLEVSYRVRSAHLRRPIRTAASAAGLVLMGFALLHWARGQRSATVPADL